VPLAQRVSSTRFTTLKSMAEKPNTPSDSSVNEVEALSASEASGVVDSIDRHRVKILFAILAGAIFFCGVLVASQLKKQKHLEASEAYTGAADKGEIAGLDAVVVNYPGSIPAGNALLSKAEIQIRQGKSEDAAKTFETFLSDYPDHPRNAQGYFALGNLYHQSGDAVKAKENYDKTIEIQADGELTPLARIRLGDLALEAGDTDLADQKYQESYTLHPGNPFFDYAEEKVDLLKIGTPPLVDRPEPEPKAEEKPAENKAAAKPEVTAPKGNSNQKAEAEAKSAPEAKPSTPEAAKKPDATPAEDTGKE